MSVRIRHAFAVSSVAALTLLSGVATASAAPTAPATTTNPAVAAAGWLAQQFVGADHKASAAGDHFDGSYPGSGGKTVYYFNGGGTADAIFALAAANVGKTKIDAAISYFAKNVDSYTSVSSVGTAPGPADGQLAKTALAAIVAGADPTNFGGFNLMKALKADECTAAANADGNDYTAALCPAVGAARNIYSSVSQSLVILAQARVGGTYAPSAAAVSYLLSLQCPNGGFTGTTTACAANKDASVDETGYAVAALIALGGHSAELTRAADWLASTRNAAGYWIVQGGPDADSTGLAASALDAVGKDTSTSQAWLASQQVTTGPTTGATASRGAIKYLGKFDATSSVKSTSDALLGLVPGASLANLTAAHARADAPVLALPVPVAGRASVAAGGQQTVQASGFAANEMVTVVLHSAPTTLPSTRADANGSVSYRFAVPTSLAAGPHELTLTGTSSGLAATTGAFTVMAAPMVAAPVAKTHAPAVAAPVTQNCNQLALACTGRDGAQTQAEIELGAGLLIVGLAVLFLGRRRVIYTGRRRQV